MKHRSAIAMAIALWAIPCAGQGAKELLDAGRKEWLRYDTQAHQAPGCSGIAPTLDSARTRTVNGVRIMLSIEAGLTRLHNQIVNCRAPMSGLGEEAYTKAEALFRQATALAPTDPLAFRNLAMVLAEKDRWRDLLGLAREHTLRASNDAWGWLALGLTMHRSGENAGAVFDTAAARMNREDRARMFAFTKLLGHRDSVAYAKARDDARGETERRFWAIADPLWSREGNDPRIEFMARVAYAELRWTVEESNVRGADSPRGEIYIRYGPPQRIIAMRGGEFVGLGQRGGLNAGGEPRALLPGPSDVVTYWDYDNGVTVVFWGAPTFGTVRFPIGDAANVDEFVDIRASTFDNLVTERILDVPSVAVRFRGPADSIDVLIIAHTPMDQIRGAAAANARVRADAWILGLNVPMAYRDSAFVRTSGFERWTFRVVPGQYQYRVEVTAEGANTAARAIRPVNATATGESAFTTRGFGISDMLIATTVQPPRVPSQSVGWTDFSAAPIVAVMQKAATFELLWENYDISARNGQAQYQVAVTVQREKSEGGRIAAAILGFAANALRIDRKDDRVTSRFDRAVAASPVIVDHVSVALGETPPGEYRITLEVTDTATGRKTTRVTSLTIRN